MTLVLYIFYVITQRKPGARPVDFLDWMYVELRTFWLVFFSFGIGLNLTCALQFDTFSRGQLLFLSLVLCCAAALANCLMLRQPPNIKTVEVEKIIEKEKRVFVLPDSGCGAIYIMRRADGVLKFGKARHLASRLNEHKKDYQSNFEVVSSWIVPNMDYFESVALSLTRKYTHQEGNRRELRRMSEAELSRFVLDFTDKVQKGWTQ